MNYIVYKHTNKTTGKIYIGQTEKSLMKRWNIHTNSSSRNSNLHFHRSIKKYGKGDWTHEILFETNDYQEVLDSEVYFIEKYDSYNNGYNSTKGGEGTVGFAHTEETKLKQSQAWGGDRKDIQSVNMSGVGNPMHGLSGDKSPVSKVFIAISPEGRIYTGKSIYKFAKINKFPGSTLNAAARKKERVQRGVAKDWFFMYFS